jgi:hypothetical protein
MEDEVASRVCNLMLNVMYSSLASDKLEHTN